MFGARAFAQSDHPSISIFRVMSMDKFSNVKRESRGGGRTNVPARGVSHQASMGALALACALAASVLVWPGAAFAADAGNPSKAVAPITIQLRQYKVQTDDKGGTKLTDAALVLPGDVVEYRAIYANRSSTALPVVATLPIPDAMEYIADSAKSDGNLAHVVAQRDAQFASEPLRKTLAGSNGAMLMQTVPYASYRFVRWDLGRLAAGSQIEVSVRAKVSQGLDAVVSSEGKASALASSSQQ